MLISVTLQYTTIPLTLYDMKKSSQLPSTTEQEQGTINQHNIVSHQITVLKKNIRTYKTYSKKNTVKYTGHAC